MAELDAQEVAATEADQVPEDGATVDVVADADNGSVAIIDVSGADLAPVEVAGYDPAATDIASGVTTDTQPHQLEPLPWPTVQHQLPESEIHLDPGTILADRYRLDRRVPTTLNDAAAWQAVDQVLDRPVHAILLTGSNATSGLDAARRAALISDPHLAKVLDVGTSVQNGQSHHYVITEPLGGQTLAELVTEFPLDSPTARSIIGEVASALDAAERHGVHHVALRPDVVRIDGGRVLLSGLGMDADYSYANGVVGDSATHDAVGLAALVYYAVSGYWPLDVEPEAGFRLHHTLLKPAPRNDTGYVVPLAQLVPGVDPKIAELTDRAFGAQGNTLKSPYQVVELLRPWKPLVSQDTVTPDPTPVAAAVSPVRNTIRHLTPPHIVRTGQHPNTGRIPRLGHRTVVVPAVVPQATPVPQARPTVVSVAAPTPVMTPVQQVPVVVTGTRKRGVVATPIVLGLALATLIGGGAWAANSVFAPLVVPEAEITVPETGYRDPEIPIDPDAPTPEVPVIRPVIASATTVDPYGDGERPQNAELVIDGDPSTYWYTYTYSTAEFGGLKPGVGFWIELEQVSSVHEVILYANGSGGTVEIRQTTPDDPSGGELLASGRFENQQALSFDAVETDGVMLWITALPQLPDGRYRLELRTVLIQ